MIYQYTGQPGHGKTLHAIDRAIDFKNDGRAVFVCNVREFDYQKTGMQEMTPDQFKDWPNFLPDGAVALVDECYEHGMLGKLAPSSKLPHHIEQLAKHRHRGIDFILVAQSPTKQMHTFVHDLIEEHVHVRRRFGSNFVHLRVFDRFEPRPEKAHPLVLKRVRLPKRPMGTYKSTELDTTEKKVPWYYYAAVLLVIGILASSVWAFRSFSKQFRPKETAHGTTAANGAPATVAPGGLGARDDLGTAEDYVEAHTPRFAAMPWTARVLDGRSPTADPRLYCMSSLAGQGADGNWRGPSVTCLTEQGTRYEIPIEDALHLARHGMPYNFYLKEQTAMNESARASPGVADRAQAAPAITQISDSVDLVL